MAINDIIIIGGGAAGLMAAAGANAQFEKKTTYISASATNLGLSYSSSEKVNFGFEFTGGYFVEKAWMIYGRMGYDHTRYTDHFQLGAGGRYYFTQNGVYMGLGLQYEHATKSINNVQLCPEVGYAFSSTNSSPSNLPCITT